MDDSIFSCCVCVPDSSVLLHHPLFFFSLNDDLRTLRFIISISLVVDITVLPLATLLILYHLSFARCVFLISSHLSVLGDILFPALYSFLV